MLLGGQYNGQVAIFDPRKGTRPVEVSPIEKSHRDPVFSVKFLASKQGTDAFSCSSDGQVLFWDVRKLAEPVETLMIDPMQDGKLLGGVALEYESTMPTKFQVGTEQGEVILFNRKGKTPSEKIAASYAICPISSRLCCHLSSLRPSTPSSLPRHYLSASSRFLCLAVQVPVSSRPGVCRRAQPLLPQVFPHRG
jgi:WD40 repeat protein